MPKDKDNHSGHAQNGKGMLTNLILLTLPLLAFQRDILPKIRTGLERDKEDYIKATEKFVSFQLHAVMMTLDPAQKLRSHFDDTLERELKAELTTILEKLAAGLIALVEIQEIILPRVIEILQKIRTGKHTAPGTYK